MYNICKYTYAHTQDSQHSRSFHLSFGDATSVSIQKCHPNKGSYTDIKIWSYDHTAQLLPECMEFHCLQRKHCQRHSGQGIDSISCVNLSAKIAQDWGQMAPLAIIQNSVTRWRHSHQFKILIEMNLYSSTSDWILAMFYYCSYCTIVSLL